ncbi:anti-sigma-K factor RskA [Arthrobacter sp. Hiyo1]|nr:anti-sigma-K factor RskA [Arthrobacter sp. Hiyo1]
MNQVLQAGDVRQATVDVNGGGTATVSISSSKNAVVVRMNGVPAPPAGKVYQMCSFPRTAPTLYPRALWMPRH